MSLIRFIGGFQSAVQMCRSESCPAPHSRFKGWISWHKQISRCASSSKSSKLRPMLHLAVCSLQQWPF